MNFFNLIFGNRGYLELCNLKITTIIKEMKNASAEDMTILQKQLSDWQGEKDKILAKLETA